MPRLTAAASCSTGAGGAMPTSAEASAAHGGPTAVAAASSRGMTVTVACAVRSSPTSSASAHCLEGVGEDEGGVKGGGQRLPRVSTRW